VTCSEDERAKTHVCSLCCCLSATGAFASQSWRLLVHGRHAVARLYADASARFFAIIDGSAIIAFVPLFEAMRGAMPLLRHPRRASGAATPTLFVAVVCLHTIICFRYYARIRRHARLPSIIAIARFF